MTYNYSTGLNDSISRLSSITDSSGTLESYDYLGMGAVVRRGHSQPGVDLTYIGTGTGAGGDKYVGLDSFGRVVDQNWSKSGTATDEFTYTYDRDGNRLTKGNSVNTAFNETYTYDGLNQLSTFNRGSGTHTQSWSYDALGNWSSVTTDGTAQTRGANMQNEITSVSGATTPAYDANGNMTTDETGKQYTYDAWNRIKVVKDSGGTTLKTYSYDGLNRRVSETASGTTTDLYYSSSWQVLEEAVSGVTKSRYVWSPVYVDALILRDRDADGSSGNGLEERFWVQQDANFNVTALVNSSGAVVERYAYDSFGKVTIMNASWTTIGSSAYGWQYLHQGGRLDASSGLYYFRNRDYSPTLGRWVTIDPIGYLAGDTNIFRYEVNSSVNRHDEYGLESPLDPPGVGPYPKNPSRGGNQNRDNNEPFLPPDLKSISIVQVSTSTAVFEDGKAIGTNFISDVKITYTPSGKEQCNEIAFIQIARVRETNGNKMLWLGKDKFRSTWNGWTLDRVADRIYGWYGYNDDGTTRITPGNSSKNAILTDKPGGINIQNSTWEFETCAVCKSGVDEGKIYASIRWGFTVSKDGNITDHKVVKSEFPTKNFLIAVLGWNLQKDEKIENRNSVKQVPLPKLRN